MPKFDFVVSTNVQRTARVMQLEGLFELPPTQRSEVRWAGEIPIVQWRELQKRPAIELEVVPCHYSAWEIFKRHHYLDTNIHRAAKCFCAIYDGRPVAFAAVMMFPHPIAPRWREHRTVCLPDFQGVGIGNALSEFIASAFRATGKPFSSVTANSAMIAHRAKSPLWKMRSAPKLGGKATKGTRDMSMDRAQAWNRITASFDFVGPSNHEAAKQLGIIK